MRHALGGGLTAERRSFREPPRMEAAERFVQEVRTRRSRMTCGQRAFRAAERKAWSLGGPRALASNGPQ
ncbi:hypothetical protein GCM10012280_70270 [Wenjunlia tyrosinilytica]|uniref:Uncharacterized protein n=1 Tax=Wenjunlia tyrosinilytica TaxID=1544741 RepID=A0A917ZZV7_9ACTN|nr:hypothetical protein GCM10012280_70270 [Wenjunlia tyrosinilytica]